MKVKPNKKMVELESQMSQLENQRSEIEEQMNELTKEYRDERQKEEKKQRTERMATATHIATRTLTTCKDTKVLLRETESHWIDVIDGEKIIKSDEPTKSAMKGGHRGSLYVQYVDIRPIKKEEVKEA